MFFELHNENRIGYKKLTDADLGRSKTSHQTHIGLFDDVLTFMPNRSSIDILDALLIYNDELISLPVSFDRIQNPNGTFRSPKIKTGGRNAVSVVSFIRDTVKKINSAGCWFLFWFGLKSEQPVFLLFEKNSNTYNNLTKIGVNLEGNVKNRLTDRDSQFAKVLSYLEEVVNIQGIEIAEKLELAVQTEESLPKKIRRYDFEKAKEYFYRVGREGEELINKYFFEQLSKKNISNYTWVNKDGESGLPFDFHVQKLDGEIFYLDVKSTNYKFEQKMIFSSQEIKFATDKNNKYFIYRVFTDYKGNKYLRVCSNAKTLFSNINMRTLEYETKLISMANVETIKLAIAPLQRDLTFGDIISLFS